MEEITETAPPAETPQPAPLAPWYKRRPVAIGAVIAAAAAGVGIYLGTSGSSSVTVHGSIQLGPLGSGDSANPAAAANGDACIATGGYTDIAPGATVTIGGPTGQTLAVTALGAGKEANVDDSMGIAVGDCVFAFSVSVPAESEYTVTVSHRGSTTFTQAQATSAQGMALTLGD